MAATSNLLTELTPFKDDWHIKVRIVKLWKLPSYKNPMETFRIELILLDEEGNTIQATVNNNCVKNHEKSLAKTCCLKTLELKRQIIKLASWPNTIDMMSIKLQKVNLFDIRDIAEIKSVVVVATIKVAFVCSNQACGEVTDVHYKYKLQIRVLDRTSSVSLTLFDRVASKLLNRTAEEFIREMRKYVYPVATFTDDGSIIEELEAMESNEEKGIGLEERLFACIVTIESAYSAYLFCCK
ncbi:nucleic acid-binding, OB-fold, replication protein A, OB domain protein [Tanacetum coccineum]